MISDLDTYRAASVLVKRHGERTEAGPPRPESPRLRAKGRQGGTEMGLPRRVRSYLKVLAARRETTTYRDLAKALELDPPNAIHRVTEALEVLMHEDHEDGAPFIAALVVSKARSGIPAPAAILPDTDVPDYAVPPPPQEDWQPRQTLS